MNKERIVFFKNEDQKNDRCSGTTYEQFIDYAFNHTDFFMLVYVNYYNKGYTKKMKSFMKSLKPFQVKRRTNPSWPGTELTICPNTSYKVVFYRTDEDAKEVLKHVFKISDWSCPENPQDLAFFKGNKCWFYTVMLSRSIRITVFSMKKSLKTKAALHCEGLKYDLRRL